MNHMHLWASAGIIAVVIVIAFAFSVPRTRDIAVEESIVPTTDIVPTVTLRDVYKKGVHTISGSLETPNACTTVLASATATGTASSADSILVAIITQFDTGVCLQVPTSVRFETTVTAPADLPITATVNGSLATTTSS